jgi:hypothetical protein
MPVASASAPSATMREIIGRECTIEALAMSRVPPLLERWEDSGQL